MTAKWDNALACDDYHHHHHQFDKNYDNKPHFILNPSIRHVLSLCISPTEMKSIRVCVQVVCVLACLSVQHSSTSHMTFHHHLSLSPPHSLKLPFNLG